VYGLTDEEVEAVQLWLGLHQFDNVWSTKSEPGVFPDRQEIWEREGTRLRLTRDRHGQWRCDVSRAGSTVWLDVSRVAAALGYEWTDQVARVGDVARSMNDRVFHSLSNTLGPSP
jgi:hypothetical protein